MRKLLWSVWLASALVPPLIACGAQRRAAEPPAASAPTPVAETMAADVSEPSSGASATSTALRPVEAPPTPTPPEPIRPAQLPAPTPLSCEKLPAQASQWLAVHLACKIDQDCVIVHGSCGMPAVCGTYVAANAVEGNSRLNLAWDEMRCNLRSKHPSPCPSCRMPPPARCVAGRCTGEARQ